MAFLEEFLSISPREFLESYYLKKHFYVSSRSPAGFDEALELGDLEVYLASVPLRHGQVIFVSRNTRPWADQFLKIDGDNIADNIIDIQKLLGLLGEGMTAVFTDMGKFIPKLRNYCEGLENELGARIQANIYITPSNSQGYNAHVDSHDVFVLQIYGEKTWRVYDGLEKFPTKSTIREMGEFDETKHPCLSQVEMSKGDLLYVPQGMYHAAETNESPSIHITLGVLPKRRSELLDLLADEARDHDYFRETLPIRFDESVDRELFSSEFRKACHQLIDEMDVDDLRRRVSRQFLERQSPNLSGSLSHTLQLNNVTVNSRVKIRPNARYWIEDEGLFTVVHFSGRKVQVPRLISYVLETMLEQEAFCPKDLSADLPDSLKVDLVKKFIVGGLLSIVDL